MVYGLMCMVINTVDEMRQLKTTFGDLKRNIVFWFVVKLLEQLEQIANVGKYQK